MSEFIYLDVATAPLPNAAEFISVDDFEAPSNYVDVVKIKAYVEKARAEAIEKAALDVDLCRITGAATHIDGDTRVAVFKNEDQERTFLANLSLLRKTKSPALVSYNGLKFDWPVLMRRSRYLCVSLDINVDRYKTPHIDLLERLTQHGALKMRSLGWYAKRLGWTDLAKPLTGAEESRVFETKNWDGLAASLRHDVEALRRLAMWAGATA